MRGFLKQLNMLENQLIRYLIAGSINTLFGLLIYTFFLKVGFPYQYAFAFAFSLGGAFNYITYSKGVFKSGNIGTPFRYVINYLFMYLLTVFFTYLGVQYGFDEFNIGIISMISVAALNFIVLKFIVFK